jgi:formate hydrogenlyase transcriptional activator
MPAGEVETKSATDGRYRTLLEVSGAIASQPNLKAILQSLRRLLSSVVAFDSVSLCLLSDNGNSVRLIAFDRGSEAYQVEIGTEVPHAGNAVGRALEEQKPIYIPDLLAELSRIPQLASQARLGTPHSAYIFPISISGKKLGALTFGIAQGERFSPDDVELMTSVSSHVGVALESAIATDAAESYQRQLARERDRLRLLLEINNQVVTQLDVNELFRSASASIRKYFANDFTGFWLIDKQSNQLECAILDFPGGKGFLADIPARAVTEQEAEKMRTRTAEIWSQREIDKLRPEVLERLKAESIAALAVAPLGTSNGPLGLMSMGSKRPNNFGQEDLDILSQISAQISLALDDSAPREIAWKTSACISNPKSARNTTSRISWARAPLCAKSLTRSRLSPQPDLLSCSTARRAPAKNWLRAQSIALVRDEAERLSGSIVLPFRPGWSKASSSDTREVHSPAL